MLGNVSAVVVVVVIKEDETFDPTRLPAWLEARHSAFNLLAIEILRHDR